MNYIRIIHDQRWSVSRHMTPCAKRCRLEARDYWLKEKVIPLSV